VELLAVEDELVLVDELSVEVDDVDGLEELSAEVVDVVLFEEPPRLSVL
jgi:hypothetical protein